MTRTRCEQAWVTWAMGMIAADFRRSSDTHMLPIHLPACPGDQKSTFRNEFSDITGSLKHRLARSLFLYALCNGCLSRGHDGGRGVVRLDGGLRGLFRPHARAAVRRGDAGQHLGEKSR